MMRVVSRYGTNGGSATAICGQCQNVRGYITLNITSNVKDFPWSQAVTYALSGRP